MFSVTYIGDVNTIIKDAVSNMSFWHESMGIGWASFIDTDKYGINPLIKSAKLAPSVKEELVILKKIIPELVNKKVSAN